MSKLKKISQPSLPFAVLAVLAVVVAGCGWAVAPAACAEEAGFYYKAGAQFTFGSEGSEEGQLSGPLGVAVNDATGNVYVADEGNNRVEVFNAQGGYAGQITGGETPAGSFRAPSAVAVDNSPSSATRGTVYVVDRRHAVVDAFDAAGAYVGQIVGASGSFEGELYGVAVDGAGNVWVYESNGNIDEFNERLEYQKTFNTGLETGRGLAVDAGGLAYALSGESVAVFSLSEGELGHELAVFGSEATGLAVDESDHDVFVDRGKGVDIHGPEGKPYPQPIATLGYGAGEEPAIRGSYDLAVNEADGTVYLSESEADRIAVFPMFSYQPPTVAASKPASVITRTSATLYGTVNANNASTTYWFQYGTSSSYGSVTASAQASGYRSQPVELGIAGLQPATTYHYRLLASNQYGTSEGPDETFTTSPATPPTAATGQASQVTLTSAIVGGTINAQGLPTSYEIELGTSTQYGTQIAGEAGENTQPVAITLTLNNLAPGSTYHYRLLAINSDGTTYGQDQTFTTPPEEHPITLPNTEQLLATPNITFPTNPNTTPPPTKTKKKTTKKKPTHNKHKKTTHHKHKPTPGR